MKFFSFKKKKEAPVPSRLPERPLDMKPPGLGEVPAPPGHEEHPPLAQPLKPAPGPGMPETKPSQPVPPFQPKEEPSFRLVPQVKGGPTAGIVVEEGFELPDFDDKEIKELKAAKPVMPIKKEVKEEPEIEEEPVKEEAPPVEEPITYPEPEKSVSVGEMRYMDVRRYLDLRDLLDYIRALAGSTARKLSQKTAKTKEDKYKALINGLNAIQDKLILIDNKLFEENQDSEVNP